MGLLNKIKTFFVKPNVEEPKKQESDTERMRREMRVKKRKALRRNKKTRAEYHRNNREYWGYHGYISVRRNKNKRKSRDRKVYQ